MSEFEKLLTALLNGESADITPKSRMEKYLKNCVDKCGCDDLPTPRTRGEVLLYQLAEQMASGGGTSAILVEKTITENGEYPAVNDGADGYSKVVVNVASGGGDNMLDAFMEGGLTEVVLPNATKIKNYAFYNDKDIQNIQMPKVTSIGNNAFQNCSNLALTSLPSGLTSIGNNVFQMCTNLALTELPRGVTSIGNYTFYNCSNLALTSLPSGLTSIGNNAFYGCNNISLTELPSGLTSIGDYAFNDCRNISLTELPSGLTSIGSYAFKFAWGLTNITIPSGVSIKTNAFDTCVYLETVTFKGKPSEIYSNSFSGCSRLKTINVPWAEGEVAYAPWGANATINYNYTGE